MGSNNVAIGSAVNSLCEVTDATDTTLTCIMPSMSDQYNAGDLLDVVVVARIV